MSKITMSTVGSLTQNPTTALTAINNNFSTVQTAMDNTLSRDGTSPNQMEATIDMNSNHIINLPPPATSDEPVRVADLTSLNQGGTVTVNNITNDIVNTNNFPPGGTIGQVLEKNSNTDFDVSWQTLPTASVNNEILYGINFGMVGDGVTDNTAAFNSFLAALSSGSHVGILPKGEFLFKSQPNSISFPIDLGGKGINNTVLVRDYNPSGGLGLINMLASAGNCSGSRIHDMSIEAQAGTSGGCLIFAQSSSSIALGDIILENLWVTNIGAGANDTQVNCIVFDGTLKSSAPNGIRSCDFKNVNVFGSTSYSVVISGAEGFTWHGGGIYGAGADTAFAGALQITGTPSVQSNYIDISFSTCNGMSLSQCNFVNITCPSIGAVLTGGISISNDGTCTFTCVHGAPSGTVLGNWGHSGIRRPNAAFSVT